MVVAEITEALVGTWLPLSMDSSSAAAAVDVVAAGFAMGSVFVSWVKIRGHVAVSLGDGNI